MIRSLFGRLCVSAVAALATSAGAYATEFPTKPVRVIVPFGPGGVADVTARIVGQGLEKKLGKPIVIENKPGAGGITAAMDFLRSQADGHTLFIVNNQNAVSPSLFKSLPYDPVKQFAPISMVGGFDIVMAVDANSSLKSVADVIAAAKKDPARFNVATIGVGSTQHLSAEMFRAATGIDVPTVPFKSSGEVISAIRGNNADVLFETLPAIIGQLDGGSLRAIGFGSAERNPRFPDVPTIAESGVEGYQASSWNGFAAPVGTPEDVIQKLNQAIREVVADPEYNQKLVEIGMLPETNTPEEFKKHLESEIEKWRKVIEVAGIEQQ